MGIDLPRDIGTRRLPWQRLRRIITHLAEDSATARARRAQAPALDTQFLRSIEHGVRVLAWQQTKDGSTGDRAPQPIGLQGDPVVNGSRRDSLEIDAVLAERAARRRAELLALEKGGTG